MVERMAPCLMEYLSYTVLGAGEEIILEVSFSPTRSLWPSSKCSTGCDNQTDTASPRMYDLAATKYT